MAAAKKPAAGKAVTAPVAPVDQGEKRGHAVLMRLDMGSESFKDGETAYVTEALFDELKPLQVFDGEWRDGPLPGEPDAPQDAPDA